MPENLDRFRRMLVYRGAGLGSFHCTYIYIYIYIYTDTSGESSTVSAFLLAIQGERHMHFLTRVYLVSAKCILYKALFMMINDDD